MFRSFRPIILGLAAFMVFNLVVTLVVTNSPLNPRFNFRYGNYLPIKLEQLRKAHPEKLDVLFIGTSQTNNGFSTQSFERAAPVAINSFNMGLPNNHYDVMLHYLEFHRQRMGKPRLVLLEVSPSIQENNSAQFYLPALYYRSLLENDPQLAFFAWNNPLISWNVRKELMLSALSSFRQYRFTFSPVNILGKVTGKLAGLAPFRSGLASAEAPTDAKAMEEGIPAETIPDTMLQKGWYPRTISDNMTTPEGIRQSAIEARKYYMDPMQGIAFDKLDAVLTYCHEKKIPVVLVVWPNHPEYLKLFRTSRLYRPYTQGLATLVQKHHVPLIDLGDNLQKAPPGLFADPRHLTADGAMEYSQELARRVFALRQVSAVFNVTQDYQASVPPKKPTFF